MSTYKTVKQNGDTVDWTMEVRNNSPTVDCLNVKIAFTIPSGVRLIGPANVGSTQINVSQGYYNLSNNTWFLGDLAKGTMVTQLFTFIVDNIALKNEDDDRFLITATLTSSCTETDATDNVDVLAIEVVDPCTQVSLSIGSSATTETTTTNLTIG